MAVLLTFARIYTADLDAAVRGLRRLGLPAPRLRFDLPGTGVSLASVGQNLVVAGTDEALAPYRATMTTLVMDDLDAAYARAEEVVQPLREVPTGRNATVVVGGVQVELVEWSTEQWDRWTAAEERG